jgi:hypothetical protein
MAKDDSFEMPDMRVFAEQSVEQAKKAFDNFAAAAQQAVNTAQSQSLNGQAGVREIGELAIRNTEKNIASFAFDRKSPTCMPNTSRAKCRPGPSRRSNSDVGRCKSARVRLTTS